MPSPLPSPAPAALTAALFHDLPWLVHGFTTRAQGNWATPRAGGQRAFTALRRQWLRPLGPFELVTLRQVHSDLCWRDPETGRAGDGLFTRRRGRLLAVRAADCLPILMVDRRHHAVAAVHAGWRGTLLRIAEKAVGEMRRAFGSRPEELRAVLGPSIRSCCYEVGEEVRSAFASRFAYGDALFSDAGDDPLNSRSRYPAVFLTGAPPGHPYDPRWNREIGLRFDLAEANRRQLLASGLEAAAIEVLPYCTQCRPELFFSHRRACREQSPGTGRMLAYIGTSGDETDGHHAAPPGRLRWIL